MIWGPKTVRLLNEIIDHVIGCPTDLCVKLRLERLRLGQVGLHPWYGCPACVDLVNAWQEASELAQVERVLMQEGFLESDIACPRN